MNKATVRQTLLALVDTIKDQYIENLAMRLVLTGCPDAHTRQTWEEDVRKLLDDPATKSVRALFAPIYAQVEEVSDEAEALALLAQCLVKGKPN